MNKQIKQRIAQLNNGEVPNGYENTDFGIFPCDWVKDKTFGDLFDFYGGLGKSRDELGDEGHAYLHYGDLHRGSFNVVSHAQYEHLPKYDVTLKGSEAYLMEDGDVAFLDASEDLEGTSRSVLIDNPDNEPFIAGLHIIFGKSKDNSLEKWYKQYITATESVRKQFQRLASGFKVYGVTREILPKIQIAYPKSTEEQSKIAEILMKWDEAIELYNQLIEKLKQLKSVCLKKMFPQRGEKVPEWRFKGFTDAWEQRKLGDIADIVGGGTPSTGNQSYWDGDIDWYAPAEIADQIYANSSQKKITGLGYENSSAKMLPPGTVLFTSRAGIGKTAILTRKGCTNQGFQSIVPHRGELDSYFIFSRTEELKRYGELVGAGSTFVEVSGKQMAVMELMMPPTMREQQTIGDFFQQLDYLITLHQCKVEKIKAQQRVLQKYLLNGIVRV